MNRPTRWAFSPLDYAAHLLLCDGDHPPGVLKARCGHLLPVAAAVHDHPAGRTCPQCALAFLVDSDAPGRFSRQDGAAVPVSANAATGVTLRIVAALPTPALPTPALRAERSWLCSLTLWQRVPPRSARRAAIFTTGDNLLPRRRIQPLAWNLHR